jgi:hypothetical protein
LPKGTPNRAWRADSMLPAIACHAFHLRHPLEPFR